MILPSPFGRRWLEEPDEGRVCHDCPIMGCIGTLAPHQPASRTASLEGEAASQELAISNVLTNIPAYDTLPKAIRE